MPLTFPEELLIGLPEVDEQHRAFYAHLNSLHASMRAGDLGDVKRLVDFLVGYAIDHFSLEERLMLDAGYPGFPDHVARHREFMEALKGWQGRIAEKGPTPSIVVELSSWLTGWLGEHIRKVDGAMARHLRGQLDPTPPSAR
jgi:hemerythrin